MKILFFILIFTFNCEFLKSDIRPNPIESQGIYPNDSCKIKLVSELVLINVYNDSSSVECTFNLYNYGENINLEIGFPEMKNYYFGVGNLTSPIQMKFEVDERKLSQNDIKQSREYDSIYQCFKYYEALTNKTNMQRIKNEIYHRFKFNPKVYDTSLIAYHKNDLANRETYRITDSLTNLKWRYSMKLDSLKELKIYPWFVWNEDFNACQRKTIKLKYTLPIGKFKKGIDKFFTYILHSGDKWFEKIDTVNVVLKYHELETKSITQISPSGYFLDSLNKTIKWEMLNIEPNDKDDIYFQFIDESQKERYRILEEKQRNKRVSQSIFKRSKFH